LTGHNRPLEPSGCNTGDGRSQGGAAIVLGRLNPRRQQATDVGIINLQLIFSYQLGGGRSLSLGNSALIYDTETARWALLNLGVNYGQIVTFAGH
jgi:hypothetical protein